MKQKIKILLENILKESVVNQQDKPKIKLVPLWQDRKLDRLKQLEKILSQEVIDGDLGLQNQLIENLGNIKHVKGGLYLSHCKNLKELPEGLRVDHVLDLTGCTSLKELPKGLQVESNLRLTGCYNLNFTEINVNSDIIIVYGCSTKFQKEMVSRYNKFKVWTDFEN
jgi:hypothetical protein